VPLYDPAAPASTWRLSSGIDYAFPPGQSVAAYGTIVVCPTSPAVFRAFHGLAPEAPVYGPFTGKLDNAGESIRLEMPLDFDGTNRPFALVERVEYGAAFRPAATPLVDLPAGRLAVYRCRDLLPGRPAARPARVARTSAGSRTRRGGRRPLRPDEAGIRFASRASCFPRPAGFLTDPAGSGSTSALRRTAC
jgi:hypothetical protein